MGVVSGIVMAFQFGTNWSRYSRYVGDIFGPLLAIEATVAFFLESTFIGLMVFGWDRMSKGQHLAVTYAVALGSNFSALWILVANSFMQHPAGAAALVGGYSPALADRIRTPAAGSAKDQLSSFLVGQ